MITQRPRSILSVLTLSLALASVAACKSEIDDKPKAKVEDAEKPADAPVEAAEEPATAAKTLSLVTESSSVGFIGAKLTGDHKGSFEKISGTAQVEGGKLTAIEITVAIDSMTTDAADLTGHLMSPDFFSATEFPEAKFTSLSITEKPDEGGATHEIAGNLELKSQAKKVTFPATIEVTDTGAHGKAEFSIDRKLWGITYPGKPDDMIKDEVALLLDLNFQ
jgi:polyisoprenoid-binding protein YceI